MNLKQYLIVVIGLFCFSITQGQTKTKRNKLELNIGYNSGALKHLGFSPVSRYDYTGAVYSLSYTRTTKRNNLFEVEFRDLNSELKSDEIPALNANYSTSRLFISNLWRVFSKRVTTLHIGLQSQSVGFNYVGALEFHQKFGISSRLVYRINEKQSISSKVNIPFIFLVSSDLNSSGHASKSNLGIQWDTQYSYALSNRFNLSARYSFYYDRMLKLNAFREVQYQFSLGLNYKF